MIHQIKQHTYVEAIVDDELLWILSNLNSAILSTNGDIQAKMRVITHY